MVNLWQSGRDGMQGAFLQPIAGLWAKKATQQTARDRLITEHTELFRGSPREPLNKLDDRWNVLRSF